ncbi:SMI1/KNR4 family protein [Streptomyces melanogenes]|uniref:SMI1/KNR4 family protein n=1 Tax=Streptomyces melanogenes TaxID=67326 RepID=UPI0037A45D22
MNSDAIQEQAAPLRLTDPYEALSALEAAVPGMAALRRAEPARFNWAAAEACLGTALPADFKLLAELYPPLSLGDYMVVHTPPVGAEHEWAKAVLEEEEDTADLLDVDDLSGVLSAYPAPGGLLVWGSSFEGDTFLWTTHGISPQEWKVTVATHNSDWWHYTAGAIQFTADLISGALEPWGLPPVRPEVVAIRD